MSSKSFVHLHLHTPFSPLDGMVHLANLMEKCKRHGMPAVAMTDHGNLFGAVDFYKEALKHEVKPILGCEVYLAPGSLHDKKEVTGRRNSTHLTLLAENEKGWRNLIKLVTQAHLEGEFHGEPRTDREALAKYAEGLICLSGCVHGPINEWILQDELACARREADSIAEIFGRENFYLELMDLGSEQQRICNQALIEMHRSMDLQVVATNNVHFLNEGDYEAHDVLACIASNERVMTENRHRFSPEIYLKTPEEMRALFGEVPQACEATLEIAERCNVELQLDPTSSEKYPQFGTPDGSPRDEYFRKVCFEGLDRRYQKPALDKLSSYLEKSPEATRNELEERLNYELDTINRLGFASYFLITADFIQWARDHDIPVGPGRGSAAGSLVAYTMGITDICPMRYGLLFERFLNAERVSPPDVDIDFCQSRRQEVISYVREKYGERSVSHIITYGKMKAKSVLKDCARVLDMGYGDADRLAKLIDIKDKNLGDAHTRSVELRNLLESNAQYKQVWKYAKKLEGLIRNVGVHAAGVVIGDSELDEHVALTRGNEGEVVTQLDMGGITDVGLLKMDFLGLKNLTIIKDAEGLIRKEVPEFDAFDVDLEDQNTFDLLNEGSTAGVFQLESAGMIRLCRSYQIGRIDDVIDLIALYRPGAMQFIPDVLKVKNEGVEPEYEHPYLEKICRETHGVMIYQEQVQNAAKLLAGFSLGKADLLRRAMGKKKAEEMAKQREVFVPACEEVNGIPADLANKIFDKIAQFAEYGFNKSHSACYGYVTFWTAYLKANFPAEFLAALLSHETTDRNKLAVYLRECLRMRVEVLPPDINRSQVDFVPEILESGRKGVRYGLMAIKGVGEGAMRKLVEERERNGAFKSLEDLTNRLDTRVVGKRLLENLIKAGALDIFNERRAAMFERLEQVVSSAATAHRDRQSGQNSLFDTMDFVSAAAGQSAQELVAEWPKEQRLQEEFSLLSYYVSGHPLDSYREVLSDARFTAIEDIPKLDLNDRRQRFLFGGCVRAIRKRLNKNDKPYAHVTLEDLTGEVEIMLFSEQLEAAEEQGILEIDKILRMKCAIKAEIRDGEEQRNLNGFELKELKARKGTSNQQAGPLRLTLWCGRHRRSDLEFITETLNEYPGRSRVEMLVQNGFGQRAELELGDQFRVNRCPELESKLCRFIS